MSNAYFLCLKYSGIFLILSLTAIFTASCTTSNQFPYSQGVDESINHAIDSIDSSSKLSQLSRVGNIDLAAPIDKLVDFQVKNQTAYIAYFRAEQSGGNSYIEILDVQHASKPAQRTSLSIDAARIDCIAISDQYLVISAQPIVENRVLQEIKVRLYDIVGHAPELLTEKVMPYPRCQALHISQGDVYLATYDGVAVFDLPKIQSVQLAPKRDIQHILTMDGDRPFTVYVGGYCGGKWGCTTFVESIPAGGSPFTDTTNRREWGGLWYAGVGAWNEYLFLVGGTNLTIQQMSENAQPVGFCSVYADRSTLEPFQSAIHFVGHYGIYLSENHKISTIDFANLRFPKQGPSIQHRTEPLALDSEGHFVYILDSNSLTVYETHWTQSAQQGYTAEEARAIAELTQVAWEKRCVENEVKLVDEREVEALFAISNGLGGIGWKYTGQIGAGQTYQDYLYLGPWFVSYDSEEETVRKIKEVATPCGWYGVTCSCDGHVTELSISLRNAQGAVPPEIAYLTHLERLDLSYASGPITLPSEINQLKNLRTVGAMYGVILNEEVQTLPNICIATDSGAIGAGCDDQLNQEPKPGCTFP